MKIQTRRKKDKVGYWNVKALRQPYTEKEHNSENDICQCGHPRYMHHERYNFETHKNEPGFCKVHGCREDHYIGKPCLKFRKTKAWRQKERLMSKISILEWVAEE